MDELPEHLKEYFDCAEKIADWCVRRAKVGDVDVSTLAYRFAENVIRIAGKTLSS